MRVHRHVIVLAFLVAAGFGASGMEMYAQEYQEYPLETRVWMDRGHEPVLQRGESVRLYYRVSEDAFVAIFHIDTNGTARMVFPTSPQENHFARGGRDYRVLFPGSTYWHVNDDPGMGYFFAVASPEPFNFSDLRYSHYDGGWDLSFVGRQVYRDPYLAMDDYVAALVPDWEYVPYGLDFTAYHVEQRYDYPRFMCYDCHGFRPYNVWNPYHYTCGSFRMVIYNDPYYYPVSRYRGTRVVYVQPRRGVAHFGFKERAAGEPGTPQIVVRNSPAVSQPGVTGGQNRRAQPRASVPSGSVSSGAAVRRGSAGSGAGASAGVERRPSSGAGVTRLTPPSAGAATTRRSGTPETVPLTSPRSGTGRVSTGVRRITDPAQPRATTPPASPTGRPVLERRPTSGSSVAPGTTRPGGTKPATRPSAKVRKGGGTGGGSGAVIRPTSTSGGNSGRSVGPKGRSGSATVRSPIPSTRSGGSSIRPSSGSRGSSGGSIRPTVRSGGATGSSTARPTVRPGGSSRGTAVTGTRRATSPPTVRSSGGRRTSPPATTRRPPVKRKKPGGGGG